MMATVIGLVCVIAADPTYCLDLRDVANLNPHDPGQVAAGPGYSAPPRHIWIEAEDATAMSQEFEIEAAAAASGGAVVGGAFGEGAEDWIEFAFDLRWDMKESFVYLRTARKSDNALTKLRVFVNGDGRGAALVPVNDGRGEEREDFVTGLCSAPLGRLHMGRQVVRVQAMHGDEPMVIDGMWITATPLNVTGHLDGQGTVEAPLLPGTMVYRPGLTQLRGAPYELIDPRENDGNAVLDVKPGRTALPTDEGTMSYVSVLATSPGGGAEATLHVAYTDGRQESHPVRFGPFHDKRSQEAVIALGSYRYGYLAEVDLKGGTVEKLEIETEQRILVLAVSFRP